MMHFFEGFEKRSWLPRLSRLPRHPNVTYIGSQAKLRELGTRQWLPDKLVGLQAKLQGISKEKARALFVRESLKRPGTVLGTIAPGPSGKKHVYIYEPFARKAMAGKSRHSLHDVIHHENFHAKVPVLGHSEILAHIYGGLRSKPGRLSLLAPLKDLGTLARARPDRLTAEVALGTVAVVGGKELKDKLQGNKNGERE